MVTKTKHLLEYSLLAFLFLLLRLLPFCVVSSMGALLGKMFATLPIKTNTTARKNIRKALKLTDENKVRALQSKATENIVRTFFEMPKVYYMSKKSFEKRVITKGFENILPHPNALVLTAHFGNWDMLLHGFKLNGMALGNVYRRSNNPLVDKLIFNLRKRSSAGQFAKGSRGAKQLIKAIQKGTPVGFLNDQKMNDGIAAPFFSQQAMTASALAELSLRYERPVFPVFCKRLKGGKFELSIGKALTLPPSEDKNKTILNATTLFNKTIEDEIKKSPEQWMWMHKRFG